MELTELQRHWDAFGEADPLWAILTEDGKKGGRWDLAEFFEVGRAQVADTLAHVEGLGLSLNRRRALDFGCGVGRLTQALGEHFGECDGVDIAPSMIEGARAYNRHGDRCRYHLNGRGDLGIFEPGTFDFIYTWAVLQHINPRYSKGYLAEFVRVLAPGGVLAFQLPIGRHLRPLDESGYRAKLAPVDPLDEIEAGSGATVRVRVTNLGAVPWPETPYPEFRIRLGNHWLDERGRGVVWDDGRAALPAAVAPDEEVEVEVAVRAPDRPGRYKLELDLVQEGVCWFRDKGSESALGPVRVRARRRRLSDIFRKLTLPPPKPNRRRPSRQPRASSPRWRCMGWTCRPSGRSSRAPAARSSRRPARSAAAGNTGRIA